MAPRRLPDVKLHFFTRAAVYQGRSEARAGQRAASSDPRERERVRVNGGSNYDSLKVGPVGGEGRAAGGLLRPEGERACAGKRRE